MYKEVLLFLSSLLLAVAMHGQKQFAGKFSGEQNGVGSSADFKVVANKLSGTLTINGKKGIVSGTFTDAISSGTVHDIETGTIYQYKSFFSGTDLHFIVTFPELNNLDVDLVMQKQNIAAAGTGNNKSKDARLIGVWKYTDIISSGSGGNYGSFSTDYFMELKADGTALSWIGNSAGGAGDVSISGSGDNKIDKGQWYTEGKNLILLDPATNQRVTTIYAADANRMMLHNGGSQKRIWERIR